jgi:hypothetical protein
VSAVTACLRSVKAGDAAADAVADEAVDAAADAVADATADAVANAVADEAADAVGDEAADAEAVEAETAPELPPFLPSLIGLAVRTAFQPFLRRAMISCTHTTHICIYIINPFSSLRKHLPQKRGGVPKSLSECATATEQKRTVARAIQRTGS